MNSLFSSNFVKWFVYFFMVVTLLVLVLFFIYEDKITNKIVHSGIIPPVTNNATQYVVAPKIPDEMEFAGEKVPLELLDVRERLDAELIAGNYWHSYSMLLIKRANRWFPVIEPILKKNDVPDDIKYLCMIESGLTNAVSPKGATGFWQFMKPAGKEYGLEINGEVDERYHVEKATEAACKYLKDAKSEFGSWAAAAAAYNYGFNGVRRQIERQKEKNYYNLILPDETEKYMFRILAAKEVYENQEKYGFNIADEDLYPEWSWKTVKVTGKINHWTDFAKKYNLNYRILKIFNPWLRDHNLTNKSGKTYEIKIPDEESIYFK